MTDLSFLHLVAHTPDMFPKIRPYSSEIDELALFVDQHRSEFMFDVPTEWEDRVAYETFLGEAKTAWVLQTWIEEVTEEQLIEQFSVQPGDLYRTLDSARWLLYATHELGQLFEHKDLLKSLNMVIERIQKGVKAELLPLVRLEGIGRVRARILYNANLKSIDDLRKAPFEQLTTLPMIGPKLAKKIKDQVGGYIKAEEWKKLKKGDEWEQRALTEY
jgi:helicase